MAIASKRILKNLVIIQKLSNYVKQKFVLVLNLEQTKRGGKIITCEQKMVLKYLMSLIPRHHYGKIAVA